MNTKDIPPQNLKHFTPEQLERMGPEALEMLKTIDLDAMAHARQRMLGSYRWRLESACSAVRVTGINAVCREDAYDLLSDLKLLLADDAPYASSHGSRRMICEVRSSALAALQSMYGRGRRVPDFGKLKVRKAMPAEEAQARAAAALERLDERQRRDVLKRTDEFLQARVEPFEHDLTILRDYRILQELALIEYREEEVDPVTYLTPLQEEVRLSQTASPRPCPHLRVATPGNTARTLGFLYRDLQTLKWKLDFAECDEAEEAADWVRSMLTLNSKGVFRVVRDKNGIPVRETATRYKYNGLIPMETRDAAELLLSMQALVGDKYFAEVRQEQHR